MVEEVMVLALLTCALFSFGCWLEVKASREDLLKMEAELCESRMSELLARAAAKEMATELLKIGGVPIEEWKVWMN